MRKAINIFLLLCIVDVAYPVFSFAQTWSALGAGIDTGNVTIFSLAMYNGELYAGGSFTKVSGVPANYIAKWDGTNWHAVGGNGMNGYVFALSVYNGELYAGGAFTYADGKQVNRIARWNGNNWDSAGSGMSGAVRALCVHNGELYAGGGFTFSEGIIVNEIARWNGAKWDSVGGGITSPDNDVATLEWYNNNLFAGGYFNTVFGHIAQWNGIKWDTVACGAGTGGRISGNVLALCTHNGELYGGGDFVQPPNGALRIAKWTGTIWDSVGTGFGGMVLALTSYNGALYAGGNMTYIGNPLIKNIAKWNGSNWLPVGSGVNGDVGAFVVDTINDALYVGGGFTMAGGIPALKVAKWTAPNGIDETNSSSLISIYPNPAHTEITIAISDKTQGISEKYSCSIKNMLGQTMEEKNFVGTTRFDVSTWPRGMYFIDLKDEKGVRMKTEKVIVE